MTKLDEIIDLASELKIIIDTPVSKIDTSEEEKEMIENAQQITQRND